MSEQDDAGATPDAQEFALLLRHIWMSVVRATRAMEHLPSLPGQHVEVLQRVSTGEGLTPAQLADAMQLSRPTISELVHRMVGDGLLERVPSPTDGRSVLLRPTSTAVEVMEAFAHGVATALTAGLDRLPVRERRRLLTDIPALRHLGEALDAVEREAADQTEERSA